jgi:hypothetical protein
MVENEREREREIVARESYSSLQVGDCYASGDI